MANQSPSRPRTKTSEFAEFFRGAGQSSQLRHPQIQKDSASMNLEVPTSGDESYTTASISKKKITRIPLFGRSRKKSNQSTASSPFATSGECHSMELGEPSSRAPSTSDRRPSEPTPPPPLPVPSKAPSKPSTSLTSKFAAHFSHARSPRVLATPQAVETPLPPQPTPSSSSSGLAPPDDRSSSLESSSSRGARNRSTTPRPARPTITVSLSADTNDDEFKDLFTRPTDVTKRTSKAIERAKQQHTPSSSPAIPSPEPATVYKRGQTPAAAIAAAVRHQQNSSIGSNRPPSTSSKNSNSRKNSDSDKSIEKTDGTSTPRASDSPRESPRLEKGLPPSLSRRVSSAVPGSLAQSSDISFSSTRSRMKPPSTHGRSRPPSIPLPLLPPSSPPPSSPLPSSPADLAPPGTFPHPQPIRTESGTSQKVHVRPRAHTISSSISVPISSVPVVQSVTISAPTPSTDSSTPVTQSFDLETLDIDTASNELLRQALKARNKQYADLTALVLKMTEEHLSEVSRLEKKISVMDKEARKRDTQIKGFTWLFNDRESSQAQPKPLPSAVLNQSRFAPSSTHVVVSDSEYDGSTQKTPYGSSSRRLAYQSDSGAESHATSGAESLRASGSESVSSGIRNTKLRVSRTSTMMRSPKIPPAVNGDKFVSDIPYSKRSSMSSFSVSPSSSTSSLLPPSPSITMSSLSAIPEVANSPETLRLPRHESFSDLSEERRAARASQRVSVSSLASSSTAASSSYSVNIKRSRPPSISIAQVLEKSPDMQDTLENLRRFS